MIKTGVVSWLLALCWSPTDMLLHHYIQEIYQWNTAVKVKQRALTPEMFKQLLVFTKQTRLSFTKKYLMAPSKSPVHIRDRPTNPVLAQLSSVQPQTRPKGRFWVKKSASNSESNTQKVLLHCFLCLKTFWPHPDHWQRQFWLTLLISVCSEMQHAWKLQLIYRYIFLTCRIPPKSPL